MAKEEIAHYRQFILLPQCFQMLSAAEVSESVYVWEKDNHMVQEMTLKTAWQKFGKPL